MDDDDPLVSFGYHAQINNPNVSQTSSQQQTGHSLWVSNVVLLQMEATIFLVGKEGFNPKPFPIPVAGFLGQSHIGDQINRLLQSKLVAIVVYQTVLGSASMYPPFLSD